MPLFRDADIDALDEDSYTPLLIATAHGQTDALKRLIDRGAPVDALDKDGKSVVFVAAEENHAEVLQVMTLYREYYCDGCRDQRGLEILNPRPLGF